MTAQVAPVSAPVITLQDSAFGYADRAVITGVDLTIRPGEVVALLGPNGSGKSTLVKGILGLNEHLGGTVELFGTPARRFHERYRIGYVPQRHSLSTSVRSTVREVVAIGRLPHRSWWRPTTAADTAAIDRALDLVGLADRSREDVSTLSGGQQRRVLIARALAAQPDILVMDEPTAGVDAASQEVLAEVLARLAARGTTMLVVTHELEPLAGIVTRVVCTRAGAIDYDGPMDAYLRSHGHAGAHAGGHSHHHEDDPEPGAPKLRGSTSDGPLDRVGRRARG